MFLCSDFKLEIRLCRSAFRQKLSENRHFSSGGALRGILRVIFPIAGLAAAKLTRCHAKTGVEVLGESALGAEAAGEGDLGQTLIRLG
jgi:hypothetical protein